MTPKCPRRIFTPSHPTLPLSISQDMKAELQPFRRALCLFEGSASLFPGAAKVSEISGLPGDQEFMSLSSSFDLYLEKTSLQMQSLKTVPFSSSKQSLDVQISTWNVPQGFAVPIQWR